MTLAPDHFVMVASGVVRATGIVVCDKLRVTRLEDGEVASVAAALAQLAQAYDLLGQLDPRTAAWLAFGIAVAGVAGNREKLPPIADAPAEQAAP